MLKEGDQAPAIPGLEQFRGKRVVLYFYPKADTPGCTAESCEFRDRIQAFTDKGIAVAGISPDKPAANAKFQEKYNLPFALLSDEDKSAAEAFGVWKEKLMYGRKVMGARARGSVTNNLHAIDLLTRVGVAGTSRNELAEHQ
jgi:peroxiredoxin Q/BCP